MKVHSGLVRQIANHWRSARRLKRKGYGLSLPFKKAQKGDAPVVPNSPNNLERSLIDCIERSALQASPFPYVYLQNIFSDCDYESLLRNLPSSERYREFYHPDAMGPDDRSTRLRFFLYPEMMFFLSAGQRKTWRTISKALRSDGVQSAFKRKFRTVLERRFGCGIDSLSFHANLILARDLPGYRIGMHADTHTKAITVQFYLPQDTSQAHLGTVFHYGQTGDLAQRTTVLQFSQACGYAFPVQPLESWHSVPQTSKEDGERNSIMLTYYVKGGFVGSLRRLRQRSTEFWNSLLRRRLV